MFFSMMSSMPLARPTRAPLRPLILTSALLLLAACKADVDHLRALVPSSLTITEDVASDAKRFNCQRATFLATAAPDAMDDWTKLGRLFDAKLSACLDIEEQLRWKQAIARGTAYWLIVQRPEKAHLWFDSETGRLQVMTLQQDKG